ncbi:hypothetical protein [Amycolatopsis sp. NPDC051128]|uniref:hypothetical protein n=1 Tax=Amycolatopsis sp. NPDC051128 TaxID=3155412 RepID=UPI003442EEF1
MPAEAVALAAPQRAAELGAGVLAAITPPRIPEPAPEPEVEAEETAEVAAAPQTAAAEPQVAPEVPVERPLAPAAAELYDEVRAHDDAGQAELDAALRETLGSHRSAVAAEEEQLGRREQTELGAVGQAVAAARRRVAGAVAAAQAAVAAAGSGAQAELAARHTAQQAEAGALVAEGAARVRQAGTTHGDEAVSTAGTVASSVRGAVEGQANDARQRGASRLGSFHGESEESTTAMRRAAQEVAGQTAEQILGSLGSTDADLRAAGPEVRGDLVRQAGALAEQIGRQTEPVHRRLAQAAEQATGSIGRAAGEGNAAVAAAGGAVSTGLTQLLTTVRASIRQRAAAGRTALRQSAGQVESALAEQGAQTAAAGRETTAGILAQVTGRPVRRRFARQLGDTLAGTLREAYGMSAGQARAMSGQIASEFSRAAAQVHESIGEAGAAGAAHAGSVGASGARQAAGLQERLARQLTTLMREAVAQGDQVVDGTAESVFRTATEVDQGFAQAVRDLRTRLDQHAAEARTRTGEPLTSLDARMTDAAERARSRVEDGWLLSQLADAWDALTPGFIAGLVVGLLVTIAIVAICGTGIGALILAGAVAGAASALASNATDYAAGTGKYAGNHPWSWSEVGKEMFFGAVFGAAGGALGAGVSGAIGARTGSTILNGVARSVFAEVATQQAASKVANVVVGVGMGVVQNVVTEGSSRGWDHAFDHWDRGLLLNAAVSGIMVSDAVGGRIHAATEGARGTMVDAGMAYNVTPGEFTASSARLADRAGVAEPAPAAGGGHEPVPPGERETAPVPEREPATGPDAPLTEPTVAEPVESPSRTPMQEQVEQTTGVDRGAAHEQSMAELREFYENQQREAAVSTDVRGTRIDQMVDASGAPMTQPDGSPYGYGVQQGFEVRTFDYGPGGKLTEVTMKVRLEGQPGVTPAELVQMQNNVHAGIDQHYNNGRTLPNGDRLHVTVEFVTDAADAHLNVAVEPGNGPTVQNRWFTGDNPTTLAHELGHQLGFLDEYIDPRTVNRGDATAPGVHQDGSLMGDFWLRDARGNVVRDAAGNPMVDPATGLQDRHLDQLGADIDAARATGGAGGTPAPGPREAAPAPDALTAGGEGVPTRYSEVLAAADQRIKTVEAMLRRNPELATRFQGEARALRMAYGEQRDIFLDISPDSATRSGGMNALAAAEQGAVLESRAADLLGRIEEARTGGAADTGAFDNTAFQNEIRHLSPNERVALVEQTAGTVAERNGWTYDSRLSSINNRSVYRDSATGTLYAVDTQHGTFERCAANGRHLEEVNFVMESMEGRDPEGRHDLTVP